MFSLINALCGEDEYLNDEDVIYGHYCDSLFFGIMGCAISFICPPPIEDNYLEDTSPVYTTKRQMNTVSDIEELKSVNNIQKILQKDTKLRSDASVIAIRTPIYISKPDVVIDIKNESPKRHMADCFVKTLNVNNKSTSSNELKPSIEPLLDESNTLHYDNKILSPKHEVMYISTTESNNQIESNETSNIVNQSTLSDELKPSSDTAESLLNVTNNNKVLSPKYEVMYISTTESNNQIESNETSNIVNQSTLSDELKLSNDTEESLLNVTNDNKVLSPKHEIKKDNSDDWILLD